MHGSEYCNGGRYQPAKKYVAKLCYLNVKILLTGATGFVGSKILSQLLHSSHNVTIIKRIDSDTSRIDNLLHKVNIIGFKKGISERVQFDCIIHAATSYETGNDAINFNLGVEGSDMLSANINLPVYLLDYAVNNKCKKL